MWMHRVLKLESLWVSTPCIPVRNGTSQRYSLMTKAVLIVQCVAYLFDRMSTLYTENLNTAYINKENWEFLSIIVRYT